MARNAVPRKADMRRRAGVGLSVHERFDIPFYMPHIGIAKLVRAFERQIGKEATHRIVRQVSRELNLELMREAKAGKEIASLADFLDSMKRWPAIFGQAADATLVVSDGLKHALQIRHCLWAQAWRAMGAADIGYLWNCSGDGDIELLDPRLKFRRTATLMEGADVCDSCYCWEE